MQLKLRAFEEILNRGSFPVQVVALAREHGVDHRDSTPPIVIAQAVERRPRTDALQIVQVSVHSALDRVQFVVCRQLGHESKARPPRKGAGR